MGQIKKSVAPYHHRKKKVYFRFCLQYLCMGLRKKSIDTRPPPKKKFWLLLWYMGHGKKLIRLDPNRRKILATTVHRNKKKLNWHSIPTEKMYICYIYTFIYICICSFPATVLLWYMGLEKRINLTGPWPKKIYLFSFLTAVLLWCTGLGTFFYWHSITPHQEKKNCF